MLRNTDVTKLSDYNLTKKHFIRCDNSRDNESVAMASLSERAARPLIQEKDTQVKAKAISEVAHCLERETPQRLNVRVRRPQEH